MLSINCDFHTYENLCTVATEKDKTICFMRRDKFEVVEENPIEDNGILIVERIFDDTSLTTTLPKNTTHGKLKNDEKNGAC